MTNSRRFLVGVGPAVAAAVIFSPLGAVVAGTRLDRAGVAEAFASAVKPFSNSIAVAGIAALVAAALGTAFALTVERASRPFRSALWVLALLALMVPPYVVGESAIVMLGPAGKLSRGAALLLGWGPSPSDAVARARFTVAGFVYTWQAAGAVLGGCFFPMVALAVAAAYRRTDRRIFEAARLARGPMGVVSVASRVLTPPAIGGALLVFAVALTEAVVPQLLRVPTMGDAIYERIQEGDLSAAGALGLTLLPAVVAAGALGAFVLLRARAASLAGLEGEVSDFTPPPTSALANVLAATTAAVALTSTLALPATSLTWLAATARSSAAPGAGAHRVLRASGFADALHGAWELASDDAVRTALLATFTATLATVAATWIARPLSRRRSGAVLGVLGAGIAVPAPLVGLGLIKLWNRGEAAHIVLGSLAGVVLCWLARFLPVTLLLAQAALARVPVELEEAAALAGRGPARRLAAVVLPAAAPGLAAAWLATYVLSATEFHATLLVTPAGAPLLAPSVVNLMRRGPDPEIAAVQVLLLSVVAAPVLLVAAGALMRSGVVRIARGRRDE